MLRVHQTMFVEVCRQIKADEALRKVVALICPGGGKSALPVIAAHELIPYVGDAIAWATPRSNLRTQAEEAFTDGWLRSILGHTNEIRKRSNEADLLLGKVGYSTTYQALVAARNYRPNPHISLFDQRRVILFLDEPQHVALDEEFYDAVKPLVDRCAVLVLMSGGLGRNDNKRVGFLDYLSKDQQGRHLVDLSGNRQQAVIQYGLADATREHAIIKINFELRDCAAEWDTRNEFGKVVEEGQVDSFDGASNADTGKALFTALSTEFSESLLTEAAEFWRDRRRHNPRSLLLVVVPYISHAERAQRFLKKMGLNVGIATSNEDDPQSAIDRFRQTARPYLDVLVTVAMAYEGMNAPQADTLVCLTHIRSPEWIKQMIHRVTRNDHRNKLPWEQQFATIFAPKDKFFIDIMNQMKLEQAPFVVEEPACPPPPPPPKSKTSTHPRQSEMTDHSAHTFDEAPVASNVHDLVTDALKAAEIHGAISTTAAKKFFDAMSSAAQNPAPEAETADTIVDVEPPSKREAKLRKEIVGIQREGYDASPESSARIRRRGKELWKIFHKGVDEMTEDELRQVLAMQSVWRLA